MNGRDIESMSCYRDVFILYTQITDALLSLKEQMRRPLEEQFSKAACAMTVEVKKYRKLADEKKEVRRSDRLAKKRNE